LFIQTTSAQKLRLVESFRKFNPIVGQISSATNLDIDRKNGGIFIADTFNNRILRLRSDGSAANVFGDMGSNAGQFMAPKDVAVDSQGNFIVADTMNNRIQKIAADGTFLWEYPMRCPYGVVVTADDRIIAAQAEAPVEVEILTATGERVPACFGCNGGKSTLYVTDLANNRVQKYTADGVYINGWGGKGSDVGEFNHPWGIVVDSEDRVWVTDMDNHRVQVFTTEGESIYNFKVGGFRLPNEPRSNLVLPYPKGIAITPNNEILITMAGVDLVAKYVLQP
jgi:tripartite motif-containing protein 71